MRTAICLHLLLLSLFTLGFGSPTLVDRENTPSFRMSLGQLREESDAKRPPPLTSRAFLLYDQGAGRVLLEQNSQLPLPPASLTKLMTARLVLDLPDLSQMATVQPADLIGQASMGLQVGETISLYDLLWGLLIPSGNDAAMTLARTLAGSVDQFVARMNQRGADLGLAQSLWANPHGLDAPDHHSSAQDLLTLTLLNWSSPLFRQIVGTAATTVAGHSLRNTNEFLGVLTGANGVKTGTTDAAGQCLVAGVERNGRQIFTVVLGSGDRYADTRLLLEHYEQYYGYQPGKLRLTALDRVQGQDGRYAFVRPQGPPPSVFLGHWEINRLALYRHIQLPGDSQLWQPGSLAGRLEWRLGDEVIGSQPLVLY